MRPPEVALHARRAVSHRLDAVGWSVARAVWRRRWEPSDRRLVDGANHPEAPLGMLSAERVSALAATLPAEVEALVEHAERWLDGRIPVLGYGEIEVRAAGPGLDRDPVSGRPWPASHGSLIDYRHDTPGDPKLIWELNRCQELPLLVLAWRATNDARFRDHAADRLLAWIEKHPPGRGIAWANAFEPALRALSLAVAFDGLRGESVAADHRRTIRRALWQHGRFVSANLSRFSSANNHLVGELVGLLAVAVLVPELADAARWREQAVDGLAHEASRQILADGTGAEQAFAYWLFTTDLLLVADALQRAGGTSAPGSVRAALGRAADALAAVVDLGEPAPAFGDDDGGRALVLDGAAQRTVQGVASSLAAALGHASARRLGGELDPQARLLFGEEGAARFAGAGSAQPPTDFVLDDGGLVGLRRARTRMLFDVGPLGYLSIAAHGHADALQVLVSHGTDELVSDPGTGSYFGDAGLRRSLRGTPAHATVSVDGIDQSEQAGPFMWTSHARAWLVTSDLRAGFAVGEHDGYRALPEPVRHRRAVVALSDGAVLVVDRLESTSEHLYDQAWPLHPDLRPEVRSDGLVLASGRERAGLAVALAASVPAAVVLDEGRWSRRLEDSEPTWTARHRVRAATAELAALLVPIPRVSSRSPEVALDLTRGAEGTTIRVVLDRGVTTVRLDLAASIPLVLAAG
jgi:hypothetical protein